MRYYYIIILILVNLPLYSQVGVGTEDPQATLDLNGNMKIRTVDEASTINDSLKFLVRDISSTGDYEVKEVSGNNLFNSAPIFSAQNDGNWNLLSATLLSSWRAIDLTSADTRIGDSSLLNNGVYTAPQSGIYRINFEVQMESGISLSAFGGKSLALIKNGTSIWERKYFDAVRASISGLGITTIPITSTNLDTLIELNKNDTVTFAMSSGLLNLSVLGDAKVSLQVYKIGQLEGD
ncbi:hypothetical protein INR75_12495 [Zunongwangia sp. SCSIO 43204]|uniref:hypothetical protein n=1 Tax=Zunongwangia sp. SCSIO 43204 TaxID=2779359 RepID=UPI001CA86D07|nr:hypothetical protein [Zunongwangia sp. SCSIO 43204]UAB83033.1 hypothetical protein INR75_12495 [Zunongwangia sp. SCSIO 43204]